MNDQPDDMLADALGPLLAERCTPATVRAVEGGDRAAADVLWQAIDASGFCDALVPEAQGGAGLGWREVRGLVQCCGHHALPLPLAQTMVARGLLAGAGIGLPAGPVALAVRMPGAGDPRAPLRVADAAVARHLLLAEGHRLWLVDLSAVRCEAVGEGSLDAMVALPAGTAPSFEHPSELLALQALLLAGVMSGLMQRLMDMTLRYADERRQFGRSIGKFQAVQHQLAEMAEHTQAARVAVRMGFDSAGMDAPWRACGLAKATTSAAAVPVAAMAHALHGAIGITEEFDLQLYTRRLHAARVTAGSESYWHARIGRALLEAADGDVVQFARTAFTGAPA